MNDQVTNNAGLFKRIAAVMAAVRGIPKDGYNEQHKFSYMASDTVLERIGKAMADEELVIIPMLIDYETVDEKPGNSVRTRTRARFQMHICDSDGNAFIAPWAAEGVDYGNPDRALNKAMTNAVKYFLLKLFIVGAGGDDPDGDGNPAENKQARRPSAYKPATRPAAQPSSPVARAASPAKTNAESEKDEFSDLWDKAPEIEIPGGEIDVGAGEEFNVYAGIVHNPNIKLGNRVFECIQYLRAQEKAGDKILDPKGYGILCGLTDKVVGEGEEVHGMVLACILGKTVNRNARPRNGIGVLTEWLREPEENETKIGLLKQIRDVCFQVRQETKE